MALIRAHNTVHPIKRIDTKEQMLQHLWALHNCSAAYNTIRGERNIYMCVCVSGVMCYSLYLGSNTTLTKSTAIGVQSTCRFATMTYVYLLVVIKSILTLLWNTRPLKHFYSHPILILAGRLYLYFQIQKWLVSTCYSIIFRLRFLWHTLTVDLIRS